MGDLVDLVNHPSKKSVEVAVERNTRRETTHNLAPYFAYTMLLLSQLEGMAEESVVVISKNYFSALETLFPS
jgi:hypothetical protein